MRNNVASEARIVGLRYQHLKLIEMVPLEALVAIVMRCCPSAQDKAKKLGFPDLVDTWLQRIFKSAPLRQ